MSLSADGRRQSLTPDAVIVENGTTWFIVVTWESAVTEKKLARWSSFGHAVAAAGMGLRVHSEKDIRWQPRLRNVMTIVRAMSIREPNESKRRAVAELLANGPLAFAELQERAALDLKGFMQLTLAGAIRFDLDTALSATSPVWVDGNATAP